MTTNPLNSDSPTRSGGNSVAATSDRASVVLIDSLKAMIPEWHFEPYGKFCAVACFPTDGPNAFNFGRLNAVAPITSVCGPFYVVTGLRHQPLTQ